MVQTTVSFTQPRLCHHQYDMTKAWFVNFEFTDHILGKTVRKQYRNGINISHTKAERIRMGKATCLFFRKKLEMGWNPLRPNEIIPTVIPTTIKEAFEKVLAVKKSSMKKKSNRNYSDITGMFLKWAAKHGFADLPPHMMSNEMAQSYLDYLLTDRNYSGKSHNGQLGILKACCSAMAVKGRRWIKSNPFAGIEELPEEVGKNVAYTEVEAKALMQYLKFRDERLYGAASVMAHCFIRKTELCELHINSIDWTNRTIKVSSDSAKNRIQDSVAIPEALLPILEEMGLRKLPLHWYIFGALLKPDAKPVCKPDFLSDKHKLYRDRLNQLVETIDAGKQVHKNFDKKAQQFFFEHEDEARIIAAISSDKTFYSWKHTGVVMYWPVVKDPYYMMRQLRHADLKTTMIYLKSLGVMPNEAFRDANVSFGPIG